MDLCARWYAMRRSNPGPAEPRLACPDEQTGSHAGLLLTRARLASDSRVFIGPCESSVFLRTCEDIRAVVACQQFRTRDVHRLDVLLLSTSQPSIEATSEARIGCFSFFYHELAQQLLKAEAPRP